MDNNLIKLHRANQINYTAVKDSCERYLTNVERVDVSVIIPVMNRESFHHPLVEHLKKAMANFPSKTYSITFVEHSSIPKHKSLSRISNVNYIWIKKNDNQPFNKCLAMNVGSLYSNECEYYLFHDIDLFPWQCHEHTHQFHTTLVNTQFVQIVF